MSSVCGRCRSTIPSGDRFCRACGAPAPTPAPLAPGHEPSLPPRTIGEGARLDLGFGQVVVGPVLGDGGMGTVFRGWLYFDPRGLYAAHPPTEVAIKAMHPSLSGREEAQRLFAGEGEALRRLSHPNIVRFFGMHDRPGELAILLELVDGEPLSSVVERHLRRVRGGGLPCMPFARAWHYFQQLLGALAATHELGIVHRDIKPANLLIRRDGFAKLTDYGIARLPADAAKTSGGMQPGTGAYMSPEQVLGRPINGRSDLYSAAILLYEMVAGRTPFEGNGRNEFAMRAAQVEERPAPITSLVPQAPRVIDALFARALAKSPADRFTSAIELGDAFRAALNLPDSGGWQAQQRLARHATSIAGIAPRSVAAAVPGSVAAAVPSSKGETISVLPHEAEAMRAAVDGAYRR